MNRNRHALTIKWTLIDGRPQMSWVRVPSTLRDLTQRAKGELPCRAF